MNVRIASRIAERSSAAVRPRLKPARLSFQASSAAVATPTVTG